MLESADATNTSAPHVQKLERMLLRGVASAGGGPPPPRFRRGLTSPADVPSRHRQVTLRQVSDASKAIFGADAAWIKSEALMTLDIGPGRLPAMLVMGAEDPHMFRPSQVHRPAHLLRGRLRTADEALAGLMP